MTLKTEADREGRAADIRREVAEQRLEATEALDAANKAVNDAQAGVNHARNAFQKLKGEKSSLTSLAHEKVDALQEAAKEAGYLALREGYLAKLKGGESVAPMPDAQTLAAVQLAHSPEFFADLHAAIDREPGDTGSLVFSDKTPEELAAAIAGTEEALAAAQGRLGEAQAKREQVRGKAASLGLAQ